MPLPLPLLYIYLTFIVAFTFEFTFAFIFTFACAFTLHLHLISSHLISPHLISPYLISSHLILSYLIKIYRGYTDDPRNTDNAWMETVAINYHDEDGSLTKPFKLQVSLITQWGRDKMAATLQTTFWDTFYSLKIVLINIHIYISLKFVPRGPFGSKSSLFQITACRRTGHYLSQSWPSLPRQIYITRPEWVNSCARKDDSTSLVQWSTMVSQGWF